MAIPPEGTSPTTHRLGLKSPNCRYTEIMALLCQKHFWPKYWVGTSKGQCARIRDNWLFWGKLVSLIRAQYCMLATFIYRLSRSKLNFMVSTSYFHSTKTRLSDFLLRWNKWRFKSEVNSFQFWNANYFFALSVRRQW